MELKVVIYDKLGSQETEAAAIAPADFLAPKGWEVSIPRKFIVLKSDDTLVVAIGPVWDSDYYHKHILETYLSKVKFPDANISGGGYFTLVGYNYRNEMVWSGKFHDSSSDFGKYDVRVIEHRQAIKEALGGMRVKFVWDD